MRVSPAVQDGMPIAYHYHGTKGGADGAATAPFLNTAMRRLQFDLLEKSAKCRHVKKKKYSTSAAISVFVSTVYSGNAKLPVSIRNR